MRSRAFPESLDVIVKGKKVDSLGFHGFRIANPHVDEDEGLDRVHRHGNRSLEAAALFEHPSNPL